MLSIIRRTIFNHRIQSLLFMALAIVVVISLITYSQNDPSFNLVTQKYPTNYLQYLGAYLSDLLYQLFGVTSFIFPICFFSWSFVLFKKGNLPYLPLKIILMFLASISFALSIARFNFTKLPAGDAGTIGVIIYRFINNFGIIINLGSAMFGLVLLNFSLGIDFKHYSKLVDKLSKVSLFLREKSYYIKSLITINNSVKQNLYDKKAPVLYNNDDSEDINISNEHSSFQKTDTYPKDKKDFSNLPRSSTKIDVLPPIDLLKQPDNQNIRSESKSELKKISDELLSVLGDFGVKGQMLDISQGPVVTLYEFEPAAGTKSSRVIGLSDDIARSLSAISTRISVVSGRNALGLELPNKQRAFFCLRELIDTPEYQDPNILLPLILGKDLAGKPFVADLAKMPHLLVAGTTGSGKSVAINAMIMSLLYRYTPAECRLIMIDPKMLELSIYDNIPHLLTPVVTESGKAVVALKWAVREMENRYRLMSNVGVRNIAGYNAKIMEATKEGKQLERTVQVGFDSETGKPTYESMPIAMEKLPFIVVIVDEMADLMIVAGKDIESSIQRLAQMARAAGIHIIMATQRPSVDVITGVIKANFPSRISFKVTSKIDSRTILGEQGAEQLLGMGDMLYMGNSSKITRVHGPFVDDKEVEKVTNYLRSIGTPEYISAVTESVDEENSGSEDMGDGVDDESIYKKAIQIVKLERKVSISYVQRSLRIGYNRAANVIDRMEKDGIISAPSHTGKREILLPED